jgi:RNA polymerase sigma factor (sigma-70 family)
MDGVVAHSLPGPAMTPDDRAVAASSPERDGPALVLGAAEAETTVGLVRRASTGDRRSFARLIERHERLALSVAHATLGCPTTSADVVQEAMLRAWQRLGELDDPARFAPWLARIVRNLAVDAARRRPLAETDGGERLTRVAAAPAPDRLERDETRRRVNDALAALDEMTRTAVTMRYYDGMSSRRIGEAIGLSPAAVDMRLSRARAALRSLLVPDGTGRDTGEEVSQ